MEDLYTNFNETIDTIFVDAPMKMLYLYPI